MMCCLRFEFCANLFPQSAHSNGRSPLCTPLWCLRRFYVNAKVKNKLILLCRGRKGEEAYRCLRETLATTREVANMRLSSYTDDTRVKKNDLRQSASRLTHVRIQVLLQRRAMREAFLTIVKGTHVRFFFCVNSDMLCQVLFVSPKRDNMLALRSHSIIQTYRTVFKCFAAGVANVGPGTDVLLGKAIDTNLNFERFPSPLLFFLLVVLHRAFALRLLFLFHHFYTYFVGVG